ncbi:hypothetical protein BDM02DRAFT_3262627 [Thelephora ganbajun]|uniref:Uncharacterized protein n=1 Tax=Thelephora ganbajun TaxID=370292 RepID=A0ACB6Z874_THEGA|nr:hypothetical protein BDM02DRAFT_3262627 [Thelephora ganbajun]
MVHPCMIHHDGRLRGSRAFYAESAQARSEWKSKLEEAIGLRKVVQESNGMFEVETLSVDTFYAPTFMANAGPSWNDGGNFAGKVACPVPFTKLSRSHVLALTLRVYGNSWWSRSGGHWMGGRTMRRVLHLRMDSQCAMLEDFGIFLVLTGKSHTEVLIPSSPGAANASRTPQKLGGKKDAQFFTVGNLGGRTLVIYMKRSGIPNPRTGYWQDKREDESPTFDRVEVRFRMTPPVSGVPSCPSSGLLLALGSNEDELLLCHDGMPWVEGLKTERANNFKSP